MHCILLPGLDGTGDLFHTFAAAMSAEHQVTIIRYPTDRFLPYAELEILVRESCPTTEPYVLIAESYSTPLAIQHAASKPENLKALILCAGFATSPIQGWKRSLASICAPILFRLPVPDFAAKRWLVGPDAPEPLLAALRTAIASAKTTVLASRLQAVLTCDVRESAKEIAVPALYLQARQDRLVPSSCTDELKQLNPQIAVATLEGPHLLLQCSPQESAEIVREFIRNRRVGLFFPS